MEPKICCFQSFKASLDIQGRNHPPLKILTDVVRIMQSNPEIFTTSISSPFQEFSSAITVSGLDQDVSISSRCHAIYIHHTARVGEVPPVGRESEFCTTKETRAARGNTTREG